MRGARNAGFGHCELSVAGSARRGCAAARRNSRARVRVWLERASDSAHGTAPAQRLHGDAKRMSHVLDRMIRRARTAIPAVEPLYQPRYQAHVRPFAGMHAPAESAESFAGVLPESAEFVETISRNAEAGSAAGAAANSAARIELNRAAQLFEAGRQNLSTAGGDGKRADRGRLGGYPTSGLREGIEGEGIEGKGIEAGESGAPDAV